MSFRSILPSLLALLTFALLAACQKDNPTFAQPIEGDLQYTFGIIKPNAVEANHVGDILAMIEAHGLTIDGLRMTQLSKKEAEEFYAVHKGRPFFPELVEFISSGPIVVLALQGSNAVTKFREIIGATDPAIAAPGTIRSRFATSIRENAIHGSDSPEAALEETAFFFSQQQLFRR